MKPKDYLNFIGNLPNAAIDYFPNFYNLDKAQSYFSILKNELNWKAYDIQIFGKTYNQPRLTALYNDSDKSYSYSKIALDTYPLNKSLKEIKSKIEILTGHRFNSVLANLYRDGSDSNGWHADNEKELGINPIIASVSFGGERYFHFKHNQKKDESYKIKVTNGSLLIMKGEMQHHWKHQIPKTKKSVGERINLTFRELK